MKKRDLIFIGAVFCLVILFIGIYCLIMYIKQNNIHDIDDCYVSVEVDGRETARYNLSQDGIYELNGGTNTLCIENGEAYLIQADCPDKLCVNMGKVGVMKPIVCLPNRLTVTLHIDKADVDLVG